MPIPFPPNGPQVQAALQKVPTPQLQRYAAGQPPQSTGQVTPGPDGAAAQVLNARGAMSAANQRQQAMNNKVSNSTIFQQKDMELAQKAQQLQQQEQQLGVLGALMAKKAQDMQARESMGVANLPVRPDMFTAMDGGIVFSKGGGVQGYASRGLVMPDLGVFNEDRPSFSVPASAPRKSKDDLEEEDMLARLLSPAEQLAAFSKISTLTKEERDRKKEERIKELEEQYENYKKGIGGLDTETAEAIKGSAPTFQERLGRGLARLPADLRGVRLGGALAAIAGGAAEVDAKYSEREREAAKYLAAAKRKQAEADFAEMRGRDDLAKKAVDEAQALLDKAYGRERDVAAMSTEAAKAGATYLSGRDKAASQAALRERALELKQQQLAINEALAQGRINQMQAQAQMAGVTAELRALSAQNAALQAQSGALQAQSGAMDRVEKALQNNFTYFKLDSDISKLMAKDKLSPEDDKKLDTLLERRNAIRNETEARFGLRQPSAAPGAAVPANLPKEVKAKDGKTYTRPPGFSDEQWAQYVKEQGIK